MVEISASPVQSNAVTAMADHPTVRRMRHEWTLLQDLVSLNPGRLAESSATDFTFFTTLMNTPALPPLPATLPVTTHRLRISFPRYFPTLPMELYLEQPMRHPNIHPVTGFICLWDKHRVSYTVEHALHRTVAILGWRLLNSDPRHIMQPYIPAPESLAALHAEALQGIEHPASFFDLPAGPRRRRLS